MTKASLSWHPAFPTRCFHVQQKKPAALGPVDFIHKLMVAGVMSSLPGMLGWCLRYRKWLVIGYAVLLHLLVYSLALSYASCNREASASKTS